MGFWREWIWDGFLGVFQQGGEGVLGGWVVPRFGPKFEQPPFFHRGHLPRQGGGVPARTGDQGVGFVCDSANGMAGTGLGGFAEYGASSHTALPEGKYWEWPTLLMDTI